MRLLTYLKDGELSITDYLDDPDTIPSYAILSHTWGADADEVTFEDLKGNASKDKPGYEKIRFCGQQVQRDGLQYFWIDTCCIDKADKAEFSHAIRSMFRWYHNAARCYVYLSDVSSSYLETSGETNPLLWESEFRKSRWFTRGWTLQELLAPRTVEFFSREQRKLGDKISLKSQINKITNIPHVVLDGAPLSQFSVNERFRWREHRKTTRDEDGAYSLLGIFGVDLAPMYGEGAEGAFRRLMDEIHKLERCIQDIHITDPRDDKKRIEYTKGGLIKDSYHWVLNNNHFQQWHNDPQSQLLWIKGDPGKGKTMLLCGIINELQKSRAKTGLVSYFFCQATDSRINTATAVLRGLLFLLVSQQPSLVSHVRKKYDYVGKTMFEDANAWVALTEIFTDMLRDRSLNATYLIIDALDECITGLPKLLNFIAKHSSMSPRVKWIVSSRNWPDIEEQLERAGHKVRLSLELNAESVSTAVQTFIKQKVLQLAQQKKYDERTRDSVREYLALNANDTFLWVALVCQTLETTAKRNLFKNLNSFPCGLDPLYRRMMQQISKSDDAELCKQVLASITLVYQPITLKELVALVDQLGGIDNDKELREIIGLCGSFLILRADTIYFVHQSAKDFLLEQAAEEVFPSGREDIHHAIFTRSLKIISRTLQRNMYNSKDSDLFASSRYLCIYWVDHLCDSNSVSLPSYAEHLQDGGLVDIFIREKYLYWLEALSLCKSMPKGVVSMAKLQSLVQERGGATSFTRLVHDAYRFVMSYKLAIENSPLQAYASALLFSPTRSLIRGLFRHEEPRWIIVLPAMRDEWSACLSTLEDHSGSIWDASSGECLSTLEGHNDLVNSVAFSHDSTRLASGSDDETVKIWDARSGECLSTLEGHSHWVDSVAFSHDSTRLASGSGDRTVKIWDSSSGECLSTLEGHSDSVSSVAFSLDSTQLASGSDDKTVKIWDSSSGECLSTLEGHSGWVSSVAFSHDSTRLVSGSGDRTVKIWDASSGECLSTLEGHSRWVSSVAFSHDSTRLASGSGDRTVKIWDASSGKCLSTLEGHSGWVSSVAFSHDSTRLSSGSGDKTVKIWDASSGERLSILEGHSRWVSSVAFSHDSTQLASRSDDKTVKIWDASSGECLSTLEGHSGWVSPVAFSHDSTRLASRSDDEKVKQGLDLSSDCMWITYNSENLLWLPSEYRPSCATISSKIIGIGTRSGRVWLSKIDCTKLRLHL
ncbi:vegetative incompatibility protein HET-E-1 [Lojkania enalia]|uniref:Mitochondrial division protein 1 n=1 Tax=Lojkania enalia TaxID=147567 RepID=A0A9P4K1B9_9PLEO|nr:vegetative incompatibility protein HET-E-1 [Didymosphaeria enalia]